MSITIIIDRIGYGYAYLDVQRFLGSDPGFKYIREGICKRIYTPVVMLRPRMNKIIVTHNYKLQQSFNGATI